MTDFRVVGIHFFLFLYPQLCFDSIFPSQLGKKRSRTTYSNQNSAMNYIQTSILPKTNFSTLSSETSIAETTLDIQKLLMEGIEGDVTEEFQEFCNDLNIPGKTIEDSISNAMCQIIVLF